MASAYQVVGKQLQNADRKKQVRDQAIDGHVSSLNCGELQSASSETSLSPQVHSLVTRRSHVIMPVDCLDDQLTIDLVAIKQYFGSDAVSQLDIVGGASKLHSLANAVHGRICTMTTEQFRSTYHPHLIWTGLPQVFEDCYELLVTKDTIAVHICYLLGASTLERALGNLYLTLSNVRQCPSLLRDLLTTVELKQCLGAELMFCLQCLIGPPVGLNLRNLIWHGFPYPGEIPTEFGYFLIMVVATVGRILLQIKGVGLKHREYLTLSHDDVIKEYCNAPTAGVTEVDMIHLINTSCFVLPQKKSIWCSAINEYCNGRYHISTPLLLSELEHAVRRVFVCVNNCPHRLLTAESTQLYTTFDEMLVNTLEDGTRNGLVDELGAPYMEMLLDLLVHPEGPRLRDRISHGEVNIYCVSATMAAHVISVAMTLCAYYCSSNTGWTVHMENYRSLFHPLSILRRELLTLIDALPLLCNDQLASAPRQGAVEEAIACVGGAVEGVATALHQQISSTTTSLHFHMIQQLIQERWFELVKTLFVSRDMLEVVGILRRSVQHCHSAIQQVGSMLTLRQEQFDKRTLRSRQRANFELLQQSCVVYVAASRLLVGVVMIQITRFICHDHQTIIKGLKKMLQFAENFDSQTSPGKNRWDVANSLCMEFASKIISLPLVIT